MADESITERFKLAALRAAEVEAYQQLLDAHNGHAEKETVFELEQRWKQAREELNEYERTHGDGKSAKDKPAVPRGDKAEKRNPQESCGAEKANKQEHASAASSPRSSTSSSETVESVPLQASTEQFAGAQRDSQPTTDRAETRDLQESSCADEVDKQEDATAASSPTTMSSSSETAQNLPTQASTEQSASAQQVSQRTGETPKEQPSVVSADGETVPARQNAVPDNYVEIWRIELESNSTEEDEPEVDDTQDEGNGADQKKENKRKPDAKFWVTVGGTAVKKDELSSMVEFFRDDGSIAATLFSCLEDGVIDVFLDASDIRDGDRSLSVSHLARFGENLVLPTYLESFGTTGNLFNRLCTFLQTRIALTRKESALIVYWSMATWFADFVPFLPSLVISGPPSTADRLLRTLRAICYRPLLLADIRFSDEVAAKLSHIEPTLLLCQPQLDKRSLALLNASNQPGYWFFNGYSFGQIYCPKCIYVGERSEDKLLLRNSIPMHVGGSRLRPLHPLPTESEVKQFQNQLLPYRLLGRDKVEKSKFRVSGFRPDLCAIAEVLGAVIVDDPELQRGIIELLKDHDEQSRVDCATGLNAVVSRAVLFHCHQPYQHKVFVRDIAATVNRICQQEGEPLEVSSETVGHVLKHLGLHSSRLGNAGRGLKLDKTTQTRAHRVGSEHEVLSIEAACGYCHKLQAPQFEEVVKEV